MLNSKAEKVIKILSEKYPHVPLLFMGQTVYTDYLPEVVTIPMCG